jgi:AcrR family transcriptional regulator
MRSPVHDPLEQYPWRMARTTESLEPQPAAADRVVASPSRPVGRPPRISRDAIAVAAREIGLADLSLRRVADHLDVSVATLYHHIEGKDDLLRLAANDAAREIVIPIDEGQSWPRWLAEWGRYNFETFAERPELFDQFLRGGIGAEVIAENSERVLSRLVAAGFDVVEAADAYDLVTSCAIGCAAKVLRARGGDQSSTDLLAVIEARAPGDLPFLRALADARHGGPFDPSHQFEASLRAAIVGLGLRRGASEASVLADLDAP